MSRTTLIIDDAAMRGVRDLARREGRNMSDVVNEFLRDGLLRKRRTAQAPFRLPSYHMGRPRADLADRDAMARIMEDA